MQSIVRKAVRPFTVALKGIILTLIICATGSAWAATSLEESAGFITTSSQLAFKGATLGDVTEDTLKAKFGGSWSGTAFGSDVTFNNFDRATEASGTITCQAQIVHDGYLKGVLLTFTYNADEGNVYVCKTGASNKQGGSVGEPLSSGTSGYDICCLRLTRIAKVAKKPIAIWNGDFPMGSDTSTRGSTSRGQFVLTLNGNDSNVSEITVSDSATRGVTVLSENTINPLAAVMGMSNIPSSGHKALLTMYSDNFNDLGHITVNDNDGRNIQFKMDNHGDRAGSNAKVDTGLRYISMMYGTGLGTYCYVNGSVAVQDTGWKFQNYSLKGFTFGGCYKSETGHFPTYKSTDAKISYIAIINTNDGYDPAYWSLTDMTSSENIVLTDGQGTLTGGDNVGVNLNGGTVTVSGAKTAAAVFVQADTTLKFEADATLTIGGGTGPFYIADGVTLTIEVAGNPSSYEKDAAGSLNLISGTLFISDSTIKTGSLAAVDEYGRARIVVDTANNKIKWDYRPLRAWKNGAWIKDRDSTGLIIDTYSSATYGAGGEYEDVYVVGGETLSVDAEHPLTAETLNIASGTTVNMANILTTKVTGSGAAVYSGVAPTTGLGWNADTWTGTVWIKDLGLTGQDLNNYGNANSTLRLSGVSGYFPQTLDCTVPIELSNAGTTSGYGLYVSNGFSRDGTSDPDRVIIIRELKGDGEMWTGSSAEKVAINVRKWSGFTGKIQLVNKTLFFGNVVPAYNDFNNSGAIYIAEGATVSIASGKQWRADGGIHIYGELRAKDVTTTTFKSDTNIITYDTGVFTLFTDSADVDDMNVDYSHIQGTGKLRYEGSNYRTISTNHFPTALIVENNLATAGLIHRIPNREVTIGSLSGNGRLRSDWGGSNNTGDRDLKILQAKDTTYSGLFDDGTNSSSWDRIRNVIVSPGTSSAGTLTISGNQTAENGLQIESSAKVKITGLWKGLTTVSGLLAFDGTGSVSGNVTTSSGSELDFSGSTAETPISGKLTVGSGTTLRFPANTTFPHKVATSGESSGNITVYVGDTVYARTLSFDANGYVAPSTSADFTENSTWAELAWDTPYGSANMGAAVCSVDVKSSGTLTLGTAVAGKVTFNVPALTTLRLTGTLAANEINFTGGGTVACELANTLQGTIKGSVTITYDEGVLPDVDTENAKAIFTDPLWTGTNVFTNCGHLNSATPRNRVRVPFEKLGSENSFIKAPGFKGYAAVAGASDNASAYCKATLIIDPGEGNEFEFNHGWQEEEDSDIYSESSNAGFQFRKLYGTGKLILDGTTDYAQYIFSDVSDFAGDVLITYPGSGGRKSYLFGAPQNWSIIGSAFPANLVIMGSVTNAAHSTWDIPAGTIIHDDSTLVLADGSTNTVLSSKSTGTLEVLPGATATVTNILNSVVAATLNIGEEAKLEIADSGLTTLTIPANAATLLGTGILDLSKCTRLEKLHLDIGSATTFDLSRVTLPTSCGEIYYDIGDQARNLSGYTLPDVSGYSNVTNLGFYVTESIAEYALGNFKVTNVPDGAGVWLRRYNGAVIHVTDHEGSTYSYGQGAQFSGTACWHEWDFEQNVETEPTLNKLDDTGKCLMTATPSVQLMTNGDSFSYGTYHYSATDEDKCCIPSRVHPYAKDAMTFPNPWSAAVNCMMPSTADTVGIAFGDTDNGILGLATSEMPDFVELFNWVDGKKTVLAQLKVEAATNAMHIYVFSVTNDTSVSPAKNYVSFYRDGEFIHRAEFGLTGSITNFMVGAVLDNSAANGLPGEATDGYIDYVRLYDKVVDESLAKAISSRRPFVSSFDLFERTVAVYPDWVDSGAWTKTPAGSTTTVSADKPTSGANVTLTANGSPSISLNIEDGDINYGTLIFKGDGNSGDDVGSLAQAKSGKIGADMMVVRTGVNLIVDYDAVNLINTVVGVDEDASLKFNFSGFPFGSVTATTNITLIGSVPEVASNEGCKDRYSIVMPTSLPIHIKSVVAGWDGVSYKLTITPDHEAGTEVYYGGDYISGVMDGNDSGAVYADSALKDRTILFPGDTMVISDAWVRGDNDAWISGTFANDIKVTRATVNLKPGVDSAILDNCTITVESGKTLNFKAQGERTFSFGNLKLAGNGNIIFADDAAAASLEGTVSIAVSEGATLTLGSIESFVTSVSGAGTVVLPEIVNADHFDFDVYGNSGSTVELTSFSGSVDASTVPALKFDGAVVIAPAADTAYSFAKITGNGNLTFTNDAVPTSIAISEIADYSGKIINSNTSKSVAVAQVTLPYSVKGGGLILEKSGNVTVEAVYVGTEVMSDWEFVYAEDGVYRASAKISETTYATFAEAISAANGNLSSIEVLDATADLSVEYTIADDHIVVKPTDYLWTGAASDGNWATPGNWTFEAGQTASRCPVTGDYVLFDSSTTVTISADATASVIECSANVTFAKVSGNVSVTAAQILLLDAGATITVVTGVTLSPTPDTPLLYHYVDVDEEGGVYRVVKKPGTIFSVW